MDIAGLIAGELKQEAAKYDSAEGMFRAVAPLAHNHWMVLDEDTQFRGAVAAVITALDEQGKQTEKDAVLKEISMLKSLSAMLSGVPVNPEKAFEADEKWDPIGLLAIWRETDPDKEA